jgi:hypothetical protein
MMLKLTMNYGDHDEMIRNAVEAQLFKDIGRTPETQEIEAWWRENGEDVASEMESFMRTAVRRVAHPEAAMVKAPAVSLTGKTGNKLQLWLLDAGQHAEIADHHSFHFHAGNTASLIYVESSVNGLNATEYPLDQQHTWEWVQKWMQAGLNTLK